MRAESGETERGGRKVFIFLVLAGRMGGFGLVSAKRISMCGLNFSYFPYDMHM